MQTIFCQPHNQQHSFPIYWKVFFRLDFLLQQCVWHEQINSDEQLFQYVKCLKMRLKFLLYKRWLSEEILLSWIRTNVHKPIKSQYFRTEFVFLCMWSLTCQVEPSWRPDTATRSKHSRGLLTTHTLHSSGSWSSWPQEPPPARSWTTQTIDPEEEKKSVIKYLIERVNAGQKTTLAFGYKLLMKPKGIVQSYLR